jgi:hypothetical protein
VRARLPFVSLVGIFAIFVTPVQGTVQVDFTIDDMIRWAPVVVRATVDDRRCDLDSGICTYDLTIDDAVLGDTPETMTIDVVTNIVGAPVLEKSRTYFLFINPANTIEKIIGLARGVVGIERGRLVDQNGRPVRIAGNRILPVDGSETQAGTDMVTDSDFMAHVRTRARAIGDSRATR